MTRALTPADAPSVLPGTAPLPIYPQPEDLPQPFIVRNPRKGGEL